MIGRGKGQVGLETLVAAAIVLILLLFVLFFSSVNNATAEILDAMYKSKNNCTMVSSAINSIAANPGGNEVFLDLDRNITIAEGMVYIGETYCLHAGNAQAASIDAGRMRIYDVNGVVYFENA